MYVLDGLELVASESLGHLHPPHGDTTSQDALDDAAVKVPKDLPNCFSLIT
jgi:hypothetical protein